MAGLKYHYKEVHDHDTGERQAPEEPEDPEKPEEHHNRVHQEAQSMATGGYGQPPPRTGHTRAQGTKRPESGHKTPPDAKPGKTNKGGGRQEGTAGKQGAMQENQRGQKTSDQHQGQEDFWKKFHDALSALKARGRAVRGDGEPTEGTPEGPQSPCPKGL